MKGYGWFGQVLLKLVFTDNTGSSFHSYSVLHHTIIISCTNVPWIVNIYCIRILDSRICWHKCRIWIIASKIYYIFLKEETVCLLNKQTFTQLIQQVILAPVVFPVLSCLRYKHKKRVARLAPCTAVRLSTMWIFSVWDLIPSRLFPYQFLKSNTWIHVIIPC